MLDGTVISAPVVQQRISGGEAQITGSFTTEEANRLAIMLRAGALPVSVEILENRSVGPSLGADSVRDGVKSGSSARLSSSSSCWSTTASSESPPT